MAEEVAVQREQPLDNSEIVDASSGFKSKPKTLADAEVAPEKPNKEYFDEFCKLYINNYILNEQLFGLKKENKELLEKLRVLEVDLRLTREAEQHEQQPLEPERRQRRRDRGREAQEEAEKEERSGPLVPVSAGGLRESLRVAATKQVRRTR